MIPEDHGFLLLCDLKDSTKLGPQQGGQLVERINQRLAALNAEHAAMIVRPLELNYGDEIAAFLKSPLAAYRIVLALRQEMAGLAGFRFCVVYGAVGARGASMRQMGGKVFQTANRLIHDLKLANRFGHFSTTHAAQDEALNLLTNLSHALVSRMTAYQFEVYSLLNRGLNQQTVAKQLGKFPQSVSDAVRRADIDLLIDAERKIFDLLESLPEPESIDLEESIE